MLRTKSVYARVEPEDGIRVLVMRKWPRGIPKDRIDYWYKELAPSKELLSDWNNKRIKWDEYVRRYLKEMQNKMYLIKKVARMTLIRNITILCWEKTDQLCHRSLLKRLIDNEVMVGGQYEF